MAVLLDTVLLVERVNTNCRVSLTELVVGECSKTDAYVVGVKIA
jgi:hypothetical protein